MNQNKNNSEVHRKCLIYFKITCDVTLQNKNYPYHGLNLKSLMQELIICKTNKSLVNHIKALLGGALRMYGIAIIFLVSYTFLSVIKLHFKLFYLIYTMYKIS